MRTAVAWIDADDGGGRFNAESQDGNAARRVPEVARRRSFPE